MRRLPILELIDSTCPYCRSGELKKHSTYNTQNYGQRPIMQCQSCMNFFSPTKNTFMAGIRTPIKSIVDVFNARTEGVGLNAVCRIFNVAKNTVLDWERRLSPIKQVLLSMHWLTSSFSSSSKVMSYIPRLGKTHPLINPSDGLWFSWTEPAVFFGSCNVAKRIVSSSEKPSAQWVNSLTERKISL